MISIHNHIDGTSIPGASALFLAKAWCLSVLFRCFAATTVADICHPWCRVEAPISLIQCTVRSISTGVEFGLENIKYSNCYCNEM